MAGGELWALTRGMREPVGVLKCTISWSGLWACACVCTGAHTCVHACTGVRVHVCMPMQKFIRLLLMMYVIYYWCYSPINYFFNNRFVITSYCWKLLRVSVSTLSKSADNPTLGSAVKKREVGIRFRSEDLDVCLVVTTRHLWMRSWEKKVKSKIEHIYNFEEK